MQEDVTASKSIARLTGRVAAVFVIVASFLLGISATVGKSDAFDEGIHIAGGLIHWKLGHPRIHAENGYLSQAIIAAPLLFTDTRLPDTTSRECRE